MANHPFVTDMQTLRARARHHIEQGAVTEGLSCGPGDGYSAVTGGLGDRAGLCAAL